MKICLCASGGGHLEQINQLKMVKERYEYFYVVQKTPVTEKMKENIYFMLENTKTSFILFCLKNMINTFRALKIIVKEKPDIVICTGCGAMIPMCYMAKLLGKKLIFIESFAKITSPTRTGKIVYPIADMFIIQWEELYKFYPKAIMGGSIY